MVIVAEARVADNLLNLLSVIHHAMDNERIAYSADDQAKVSESEEKVASQENAIRTRRPGVAHPFWPRVKL